MKRVCMMCLIFLLGLPLMAQVLVETFDDRLVPPVGWILEDVNGGNTWEELGHSQANGRGCARYLRTPGQGADDWLISPGLSLDASAIYRLRFMYKGHITGFTERLDVYYGTAQNSAAMTGLIVDENSITNDIYQLSRATFTVPASGIYYLGFHCYSAAGNRHCYLDQIRLEEVTQPLDMLPRNGAAAKCAGTDRLRIENYGGSTNSVALSHDYLGAEFSLGLSPAPPYINIPTGGSQVVTVNITPTGALTWDRVPVVFTAQDTIGGGQALSTITFDYNTGAITSAMPQGDYNIAAAADGQYVYAFLGYNRNDTFRYDPVMDTWTTLAANPFHSQPAPMGACYHNGLIYVMNSGRGDAGNMYVYDIATDTFSQLALPAGVDYLGQGEIVSYGDTLYLMGSQGDYTFDPGEVHFWSYHIPSGTWTEIMDAPLEALRCYQGMVRKNGLIHILGGLYQGSQVSRVVYTYDIAGDTWSSGLLPNLPTGCYSNKAWIMGSYVVVDKGDNDSNIYIFKLDDPAWTGWKPLQRKPIQTRRYAGAYLNGTLYAVGGVSRPRYYGQTIRFCPLVAHAGAGTIVCANETNPVNIPLGPVDGATALNGSGAYTYAWSDGQGWTSGLANPVYTFTPSGAVFPVVITLTVTDTANGATDSDSYVIHCYQLTVDAGPDDAVYTGSLYPLGGTPNGAGHVASLSRPPYTYSWTCLEEPAWSSSDEHPVITVGPGGQDYHYTVTVSDGCGQTDQDTVVLSVSQLRAKPGSHRSICQGDATVLGAYPHAAADGVPPYSYEWRTVPDSGWVSYEEHPGVSPVVDTVYQLCVTDAVTTACGNVTVFVKGRLTAPALWTPADNSSLPDLAANFSWSDVAAETGYILHLADNYGHFYQLNLPADCISYDMGPADGILSLGATYSWWVEAVGNQTYCNSPQNQVYVFSIDSPPQPVVNHLLFAADQAGKGSLASTRTNLGFLCRDSAYQLVELTLRNSNGTVLDVVELPVGHNVFASYTNLLDFFPSPYLEGTIDIHSPDHLYLVGGLVENTTNDPSIYPQDGETGNHIYTPIVLRNDVWTTQVVLRNLADAPVEVCLTTFLQPGADGPTAGKIKSEPAQSKTITIEGNGYFKTDDIMAFMMDPQPYAVLSAQVLSKQGDITGFARQLNDKAMGGVYAFYKTDGGAQQVIFPYICDTADRRGNIGLVHTQPGTLDITVQYITDGVIDAQKTYSLPGYAYYAIPDIIRDLRGATGVQNSEGFLCLTAGQDFHVVGGPIDNLSHDPSVYGGSEEPMLEGFTPLVLRSGPWTTRLVLANHGNQAAGVDLLLYETGEYVGTVSVTVPAMDILRLEDVVGMFVSRDLYGMLTIVSSEPVYGFVEQTTGLAGASGVYPLFVTSPQK